MRTHWRCVINLKTSRFLIPVLAQNFQDPSGVAVAAAQRVIRSKCRQWVEHCAASDFNATNSVNDIFHTVCTYEIYRMDPLGWNFLISCHWVLSEGQERKERKRKRLWENYVISLLS